MKAADSTLVASLYLSEASNMRAFARRRLNDPEEADDIVNESFRILSERDDLSEIRNPAAFLMTILHRQINSHLRRKYRRKQMSIEEVEPDIPATPDIAESYEDKERAALLAESIKQIRSPRQKRALSLFSQNYKASEIAAMESSAGNPTTSHQISCVLHGGLANLKVELRRKGMFPSFLPAPWLLRLSTRVSAAGQRLGGQWRLTEMGTALPIIVLISVAAIFRPNPPGSVTPSKVPPPPPLNQSSFDLAAWGSPSEDPPKPLGIDRQEQAPPGSTADVARVPNPPTGPILPAGTSQPAYEMTPQGVPAPLQASPKAEVSEGEKGPQAMIGVGPYRGINMGYELPEREEWREPGSPQDQTTDMVENADAVPMPQCGGLPPICNDEPPSEYSEDGQPHDRSS